MRLALLCVAALAAAALAAFAGDRKPEGLRMLRAAGAAAQSGDVQKARAYARQLLDIAAGAESARPELAWARQSLGGR